MKPGEIVVSGERGPITRADVTRFCTAINDFNPIHLDDDFARAAGFPKGIVPGPLLMGYVGLLLARWAGIERIVRLSGRLTSPTLLDDAVSCRGELRHITEAGDERVAEIDLTAFVGDRQVAAATATVRLG
jgi:acyl dehydratase